MLVTDNDYPRFYGYPDDVDNSPLYMVAVPGAHPVFKYGPNGIGTTGVMLSVVHDREYSVLAEQESKSTGRQRVVPSAPVAAAMLACYSKYGKVEYATD